MLFSPGWWKIMKQFCEPLMNKNILKNNLHNNLRTRISKDLCCNKRVYADKGKEHNFHLCVALKLSYRTCAFNTKDIALESFLC